MTATPSVAPPVAPSIPPSVAPVAVAQRSMGYFLGGQAAWFFHWGIQMVIFPSLVAITLNAPADTVGYAQAALMLPSLFLMLAGGALADARDPRSGLITFHLVATIPPLALAAVLLATELTLTTLLIYGVLMGTVAAFVMPARDSLLSRVAGGKLQRAAARASGVQFLAQIAGILLVTLAIDAVGAPPLLAVQALALALGAFLALGLPKRAGKRPTHLQAFAPSNLLEGLRVVWRSKDIFPVCCVIFLVGFFFISTFLVTLPLLVRDVHGMGSAAIGILFLCFWAGAVVSATFLSSRANIAKPGRPYTLTHLAACSVLFAMAFHESYIMLVCLCALWGMGAGVSISLSRAIVQANAPQESRARALAAYQMCFLGGAPLGTPITGWIVHLVGPKLALLYPAVAVSVIMVILLIFTQLWNVRAPEAAPA